MNFRNAGSPSTLPAVGGLLIRPKPNAGDDLANRHIPSCRVLATERSSARSLVRTFSCRSHPSLEILVDCFVLLVQGAPLQREIRLLGQSLKNLDHVPSSFSTRLSRSPAESRFPIHFLLGTP